MAKSWDMTSGGKLLPPVEIEVEVLLEEEVFEEEASDDLPKKDNNNLKQNSIFKTTFLKEYISHCLGMNYYVNFSGGIGSNGFHIK